EGYLCGVMHRACDAATVRGCSSERKEVFSMTFQRTMQDIPIGTPVFTRDGEELGTLKEVRSTAFKVNTPGQSDYWLTASALSSAARGRLMVDAQKDRTGTLKGEEPKTR